MKFKYLTEFSTVMLWINLIAVLCIGMQFLFISQYITKYKLNYQLLSRLDQIPTSPATVFWQCAISSGLLFILIQIRHQLKLTRTNNNLLLVLEFLIAIFIFFATRMSYNGIFSLIFSYLIKIYQLSCNIVLAKFNFIYWDYCWLLFIHC